LLILEKKKGIKEKEKTSFFCNGKKNTWKKNHLVLKKNENSPFFFLLTHNPSTVWNFTKTFFKIIPMEKNPDCKS